MATMGERGQAAFGWALVEAVIHLKQAAFSIATYISVVWRMVAPCKRTCLFGLRGTLLIRVLAISARSVLNHYHSG